MLRRWISALVFGAGAGLLAGCGAMPGAGGSGTKPVVNANLAGNWLLAGTLPIFGPGTQPTTTGMAATIDVSTATATAIVSMQLPCTQGGFSATEGTVVTGTIAADGSFSLVSPTGFAGGSLTVQGNVPSTPGGPWSGSYVATATSCGVFSGTIAATTMPLLAGTFAGSASLEQTGSFTGTPVTVSANLFQGGYEPGVNSSIYSNTVLTGTIAIAGSPCLTSGTSMGTSTPSAVEGNTLLASYAMNDGSVLQMIGSITAADTTKLQVEFLSLTTGTCNTKFLPGFTQLVKQ